MEGHKSLYFSSDFLWARQALYVFGLWIAMRVVERKAPLSLILFFLIGSFFSFDWALSLETHWFSNMYGFLYLSSGAQAAMSLMVFRGFKDNDIPTKKDLVHLLLTISLLWFYLNFSQFIIIWMGNLPREAGWYVERMTGWTLLVWFIFGALKLVPIFLISFFKNYKIKNQLIQGISLLIFLGFILEMIWLLLPSMQGVHS